MPTGEYEKDLKAYEEDSRVVCQYGIACYRENAVHLTKYKHPPKKPQKHKNAATDLTTGRKRRSSGCKDDSSIEDIQSQVKLKKDCEDSQRVATHSSDTENNPNISSKKDSSTLKDPPNRKGDEESKDRGDKEKKDSEAAEESSDSSSTSPSKIIQKLFLTKMPEDFYEFYHFCESLSAENPTTALEIVDLMLVGPYDVLNGKIKDDCTDEPEKYLRHWRYYYDPPEFQTVIKGNDEDGLHYGYWRDNIDDQPVFVARNSANKNCNIDPVAPNIFAAVNKHIGEKLTNANPNDEGPILKLSEQLVAFAKEKSISLDTENSQMLHRNTRIIAKTFHGAGVFIPDDMRPPYRYQDLRITDDDLKEILRIIDEPRTESDRKRALVRLEDVVRRATISVDEGYFGCFLELAQDLFASGVEHVQSMALRMFASAYNLLHRKKFLDIAEAHAKDRRKGSDLGVS